MPATIGVPWALGETRDKVLFSPYQCHTVIAGATRSGKSKAAQAILGSLARIPEVLIVGCDPAGGLLQPHALARPQDFALGTGASDLDHAEVLVASVVGEMEARISRLRAAMREKFCPHDFTVDQPCLLVVLEEYAGLLAALDAVDKKRARTMVLRVGRLLREGAKVGIMVLTILQRPEAAVLHDRGQYARRIGFRLDNADSVRMLFEQADPDQIARVVNLRPGRGLIHEAGSPYQFFRTPEVDYDEYKRVVLNSASIHRQFTEGTQL